MRWDEDLDFDLIPDPPPVPDCIHEIPINTCDYCKPKPPRSEKEPRTPLTIQAKYDGFCHAKCGEPINIGQDIVYSDSANGYVHVECA